MMPGSRVTTVLSPLLVLMLAVTGLAGCTGSPDSNDDASPAPTAPIGPVRVEVSPREPFLITLPDGTTIQGPKRAVRRPGTLTVTPTTARVPRSSPIRAAQVSGFDLQAPGGALRRPVTVSFPAPTKPSRGPVLPTVVHRDEAGAWTYEPVRVARAASWLPPPTCRSVRRRG
jgi:hypothetical protein